MAEFESCDKCKYSTKMSDEFPCNTCKHGVNTEDFFKPKTNADAIRNMTDEELAEWLTKITDDAQFDARTKCDYQWGEWLKEEAKE